MHFNHIKRPPHLSFVIVLVGARLAVVAVVTVEVRRGGLGNLDGTKLVILASLVTT